MDIIIGKCPHCNEDIAIAEINCKIFRHGWYKSTYKQIDPHMPQRVSEGLIAQDAIYGCGKPFRTKIRGDGSYVIEACSWDT